MTVTGTPGTGTITLSAADTGYQSFATAYGANANVDVLIEEGSAWEIARDCTYTHSGTTLSRGTLEASSTGSALSLTSAAKVYVVNSAARIQKMIGGYLENSTHDGTAAVTGVVGTMHVFTGLTADRDFTLPSSALAGDRVGVSFPVGSASYEILLKSASGDKINNVDCSSTEWSRLFIAGETVIFRCVDASTVDWVVEYDGRIPSYVYNNETITVTTAYTTYYPSYSSPTDPHSLVDAANSRIKFRRAGRYLVTHVIQASTGQLIFSWPTTGRVMYSSVQGLGVGVSGVDTYAAGATVKPGASAGGNGHTVNSFVTVVEQL